MREISFFKLQDSQPWIIHLKLVRTVSDGPILMGGSILLVTNHRILLINGTKQISTGIIMNQFTNHVHSEESELINFQLFDNVEYIFTTITKTVSEETYIG